MSFNFPAAKNGSSVWSLLCNCSIYDHARCIFFFQTLQVPQESPHVNDAGF